MAHFKSDYPMAPHHSPLFIGLDIGTSSAKAVAFDRQGREHGQASRSYALSQPEPDAAVQDPEEVRIAIQECLQELIDKLPEPPRAIGISSAMHSLLAVDEAGKPLTPMITWADGRAQPQADELRGTKLGNQLYRHSGTPIHAMSPLCKLAWLRTSQADIFQQAARFVGIKEYLWYHQFGEWVVDHSIASATGMFDLAEREWIPQALEYADVEPDRLARPVHTEYSQQTDDGLTWVIGASDGCLANLGSGVLEAGHAVMTIGTSGAIRVSTTEPVYDEEERLFCYLLDADTYVVGGPTNNGGVVWEWCCRQFFPDKSIEEALAVAEDIEAGAEGLLFLPYLYGERAPVWNARAKGYFWEIEAHHTRDHFARAVLEGICLNLALITQALEAVTGPIHCIHANGGFTRSAFWVQLLSNILGKRIEVNDTFHASAKGAAIMAMRASGRPLEKAGAQEAEAVYTPDEELHSRYTLILEKFRQIYPSVKVS